MHFNLVFEGGGAKGLVFVGAMKELERRGHTPGRLLGTSAGAITACLLAAGYDATEMLNHVNEKMADGSPRFASFLDVPDDFSAEDWESSESYQLLKQVDLPFVPEKVERHLDRRLFQNFVKLKVYRLLFSFVEMGGLYAGEAFRHWLIEKLDLNGRNLGNATFAEFHEQTQKDLTVVASNTTDNGILILNHRTAPQLPVNWGVRMSMSVPFVWQEVRWRSEWGPYNGRDITGHTIVDGGLNSNFPIRLLISRSPEVTSVMGPHDGQFALGMLIDESMPVPNAVPDVMPPKALIDINNLVLVRRISNLVNTMMSAHDKNVMDAYKDGVCRLPAGGYGTVEFGMSDARVNTLIAAGETTMRGFLDNFIPPKDSAKPQR